MKIYFTTIITDEKSSSLKELDKIGKKKVIAQWIEMDRQDELFIKVLERVRGLGLKTFETLFVSWIEKPLRKAIERKKKELLENNNEPTNPKNTK